MRRSQPMSRGRQLRGPFVRQSCPCLSSLVPAGSDVPTLAPEPFLIFYGCQPNSLASSCNAIVSAPSGSVAPGKKILTHNFRPEACLRISLQLLDATDFFFSVSTGKASNASAGNESHRPIHGRETFAAGGWARRRGHNVLQQARPFPERCRGSDPHLRLSGLICLDNASARPSRRTAVSSPSWGQTGLVVRQVDGAFSRSTANAMKAPHLQFRPVP